MSQITGSVVVTGFISPSDTTDQYAVIDPIYGIDGLRNVATLSAMYTIPYPRRRLGMVVGVGVSGSSGTYYKLISDPGAGQSTTIANWSQFAASSVSTLSDVALSSLTSGQILQYNGTSWVNTNQYSLPIAGTTTLGGVKVNGGGVSIDANGVISVSTNYQSPLNGLGIVKSTSGTISYINGTNSQYIDGTGSLQNFPSLTGFVPYTGANSNVNLGSNNLTAATVNATTLQNTSNYGINLVSGFQIYNTGRFWDFLSNGKFRIPGIIISGNYDGNQIDLSSGIKLTSLRDSFIELGAGNAGTQLSKLTFTKDGSIGLGLSPNYGTSGQVLVSGGAGAAAYWATPTTGSVTGTGTQNQLAYWNTTNSIASTLNLSWNASTQSLELGELTTPTNFNATRTAGAGTGLTAGTTYYYAIVAVDILGNTTLPTITKSVTPSLSTDGITITWTRVTGATAYWIFRGVGSSTLTQYFISKYGNSQSIVDTGSLSYTNSSVPTTNTSAITYIGSNSYSNFNNMNVGYGPSNVPTNAVLGKFALHSNNVGSGNVAIGASALNTITNSISNTAVGYAVFTNLVSGSNNLAIGNEAGRFLADGSTPLTIASNGVFIGDTSAPLSNAGQYEIVIGSGAVGLGSYSTVIGSSTTLKAAIWGRVLIGSSLPTDDTTSGLQVNGTIRQTSVTSSMLKVDSTGRLIGATAGTDYLTTATLPSNTFTSDLIVSLSNGKTFGKYKNLDTIPATGKTANEVIQMAIVEALAPTVTLTSSTSIQFNQTAISNVLNFTWVINSIGASVASVSLEWRRGGTGTWTQLTSNTGLTTYTHSYTDSANNPAVFNYRYTVTDTVGGTLTVTKDITPAGYLAPTITFSAPASALGSIDSNQIREIGNTSSILQGSVTNSGRSPLVSISSYQFAVSTNGGSTWTNLGSSTSLGSSGGSFTNYTDTSLGSSVTSAIYRVSVVDGYQTTTTTYTISYKYIIFYGSVSAASTNSTGVRALSNKIFLDGSNPFTLATGTTNKIFEVAMPSSKSISNVSDLTVSGADITASYVLSGSLTQVNDAAGTATNYKVYDMTIANPYSPSHNHQITRA